MLELQFVFILFFRRELLIAFNMKGAKKLWDLKEQVHPDESVNGAIEKDA